MNKRHVFVILAFLTLFIVAHTLYSEYAWATNTRGTSTIIQAIGFAGLSISGDCTVTRNPLLETIDECMGDMPAGYCYHLSCNIVASPDLFSSPDQISTCGG